MKIGRMKPVARVDEMMALIQNNQRSSTRFIQLQDSLRINLLMLPTQDAINECKRLKSLGDARLAAC